MMASSAIFGGLPRFGFASSCSMYNSALRQASCKTRVLATRCGMASLAFSALISSSVISRPFKVVRDVLFSQLIRGKATPAVKG